MTFNIIISILFLFAAGLLNSVLDILENQVPFDKSIFSRWKKSFWLKTHSWKNKYKKYKGTDTLVFVGENDDGSMKLKPRFIGSTTIFVWLTDGWHLVKSLMIFSLCCSLGLISYTFGISGFWTAFIVCRIAMGAGFYIGYNLIFRPRR